jgi:hypothetical protein
MYLKILEFQNLKNLRTFKTQNRCHQICNVLELQANWNEYWENHSLINTIRGRRAVHHKNIISFVGF